jgi:hypothetical protein
VINDRMEGNVGTCSGTEDRMRGNLVTGTRTRSRSNIDSIRLDEPMGHIDRGHAGWFRL